MSTTTAPYKIALVGCGRMGSALLKCWLESDLNIEFSVIDHQTLSFENVKLYRDIDDNLSLFKEIDMLILAVKPQIIAEVCKRIAPHIRAPATILSIAAGQSIENFENYFTPTSPIIRVMPNTPAAIGKGMSVAICNSFVPPDHKTLAHDLLECTGKVEWIINEDLLDAVTAVSGSGPAYVFHLIEVLAKAGRNAGLDQDLAMELARQTVIGASALAESEPHTPASTLRENVTSPRGTTAAALEIIMDGRWQRVFDEGIAAAKRRGHELREKK